MQRETIDNFMHIALEQASIAFEQGEVPVGAVVVCKDEIIAKAHNEVERLKDATAHAEVLAIRRASELIGNWRLSECSLCVTLEPCTMCIGAIRLARIPLLIFGAVDPRMGAVGSIYDISQDTRLGEKPRVISGVCAKESEELLIKFFKNKRRDG